jgi:hypothetical protein
MPDHVAMPTPAWVRLAKTCGLGLRARLASSTRQAPFSGSFGQSSEVRARHSSGFIWLPALCHGCSGSFGQSSEVKARHSSGFIWLRASCCRALGFVRPVGARDLPPDGVVRLNRLRGPTTQSGNPYSTFRPARGASGARCPAKVMARFLFRSNRSPDRLQGNFHRVRRCRATTSGGREARSDGAALSLLDRRCVL